MTKCSYVGLSASVTRVGAQLVPIEGANASFIDNYVNKEQLEVHNIGKADIRHTFDGAVITTGHDVLSRGIEVDTSYQSPVTLEQ